MKTRKVTVFAVILIMITVIAAVIHLNTRQNVTEGSVLISADGKSITLEISRLKMERVTGIRMNGKGEEITVDAPGILLGQVLESEKIEEYSKVTVISDDSYNAEMTAEEIDNETSVFLILEDEGELRLVVFDDTDSKRSVSNVAQIVVEK